jgi:hypothetical protein
VSLRARMERAREAVYGRMTAHNWASHPPAMFPIPLTLHRPPRSRIAALLRAALRSSRGSGSLHPTLTAGGKPPLNSGCGLGDYSDGPTWPGKFGPDRKTAIKLRQKASGTRPAGRSRSATTPPRIGTVLAFSLGTRHSKEPGKRVQVRQGLVLTTWQRIVAFVTSIAIILGGIGAAAQGWAAYSDWACQIGACPADSNEETAGNTAHQRSSRRRDHLSAISPCRAGLCRVRRADRRRLGRAGRLVQGAPCPIREDRSPLRDAELRAGARRGGRRLSRRFATST